MWPNSPPKPWAPRNSSPSMTMPAPTPTSPKTQMKLGTSRPAPSHRSASAARFASFSTLTPNGPIRARSSSATATSDQPRFGARSNVPVAASVRPGTATTRPATTRSRDQPHPRSPPRPALRGGRARDRARAPVVRIDPALEAHVADEILRADGEVVDVDLETDRDDAIVELERLRGPPDAARALVLAGLAQELELDQLRDKARDGTPREPRLGRDTCARAWPVIGHVLEHNAQVDATHRRLVCTGR